MPTRMRGSAIVFATEATGVSAFVERAAGMTFGAGGFAQAASRVSAMANRAFMAADYAKTAAVYAERSASRLRINLKNGCQPRDALANPCSVPFPIYAERSEASGHFRQIL